MSVLTKAYQKAVKLITSLTTDECIAEERVELTKLNKKQLIELVLSERHGGKKQASIMDIVYALLTDEDCVWLGNEQVAAVIRETVPGAKTNANNIRWYFSQQREYGYDCLQRKHINELTAELMKE